MADNLVARPSLEWIGNNQWKVKTPCMYWSERHEVLINVPVGFVCDLASVPRIPGVYAAFGGKANIPAVIHDFLYSTRGMLLSGDRLSRQQSDEIFYDAMKLLGDPKQAWRRRAMYAAVRAVGWRFWP